MNLQINQLEILKAAIQKFGPSIQMKKLHGECLELALEILKLHHPFGRNDNNDLDWLRHKVVDLGIMVKQAFLILGLEDCQKLLNQKLNSLAQQNFSDNPLIFRGKNQSEGMVISVQGIKFKFPFDTPLETIANTINDDPRIIGKFEFRRDEDK